MKKKSWKSVRFVQMGFSKKEDYNEGKRKIISLEKATREIILFSSQIGWF